MKKTWKRLCMGFLALATVVTALPTTPVHAESKQYWTESAERVGIIEKVMNDGSIGSTFNEGYMKVEGETAYCIDINTDFKNGYKTRADASSRMSADQISDVALSLGYVKQYGETHKELNYKQVYLLEQCVVWQRLSVHLGWQCDNVRASYDEIPKATQDEVFAGARAFVKENKGRYECGGYIYSGEGQELGQFWAKLNVGNAKLQKTSSNTSITDGNGNYSIAGATYGVFSDKDCTKQLATLTTDENGNTDVAEVTAGTVYIKELSAPAGYKVDKTVYSLKVEAGKTATLKVSDTGLIKRETSKALHAVINFVVVFVLSASFIAYAPDYIKKINEFSSDISTASLDLGTKIMLPNSDSEGKDSVDLIRDSLFSIQVEQPWLLLQFGNSNTEEIGADRVEALVSASPEDEDGKTREEVVKTEIEDNDNNNLTIPQVVNRLGMVFFLLFFNLGITIFVFLLTGMMLFSQILFIIFAMFLPISFLLSMIPSYESMAKQAIVRVFNTIMTRAGITLIVTVAFSISSMFYNISTDYPFFMVAFLQIVCFAGIYMKLGDLMSMFSLNAGDSQSMGHRIFRRPYLFMRHRARRMEHRIARAVSAGGISGGVAGAVAGSAVAGKRAERKNTASKENRGNTTSSVGQRAGSKVGAVLDTKNKVKDKANAVKENIKDMPTQTAYAVYSTKEKAKSSVSDFKRGMVQEQQSRQSGRLERQAQHRQSIADKRIELQKAQEARQAQRKTDGSATTGATRPHERPATASTIPKPSAEKMQEVKRPATATTSKASAPVKTNVVKERPLSSGASDRKATQPAQPVHRQNVEKVVSQETHQNDTKDRRIKVQQTQTVQKNQQTIEKTRNLVTKKGQKKK
ncbi:CD3337/EF1877 family mobilome membrane protein [Mediterraneibacter faecis]